MQVKKTKKQHHWLKISGEIKQMQNKKYYKLRMLLDLFKNIMKYNEINKYISIYLSMEKVIDLKLTVPSLTATAMNCLQYPARILSK